MNLQQKFTVTFPPYLEHSVVNDPGFRGLRIVRNRFSNCFVRITPAPELATATSDTVYNACFSDFIFHPLMPVLMSREGLEIGRLELFDHFDVDVGLLAYSKWFPSKVSTMPNLLAHEPARIMSVVRLLCKFLIFRQITGPRYSWPT